MCLQPIKNHLWPYGSAIFLIAICLTAYNTLTSWLTILFLAAATMWAGRIAKECRVLSAFAIVGFVCAAVQVSSVSSGFLPDSWINEPVIAIGRVSQVHTNHHGTRFTLSATQVCHKGNCEQFRSKFQLKIKKPTIENGERGAFTVKLKPLHGYRNPGLVDPIQGLIRNGVTAQGSVIKAQKLEPPNPWIRMMNRLQANLVKSLENVPNRGVLSGLLVGDKSAIDEQVGEVFMETGTAHLLAISGLHIGCIAGFVYWLLAFVLPFSSRRRFCIAALIALGAAFTYAFLAGMTVPTQRALIMISTLLMAPMTGLSIRLSDRIAIACFLVLLIDPLAIYNPGFWLSFGAVSIFAWAGQLPVASKIHRWIILQWAAFIGLLPMSSYFFGQLSLISPLANMFAIPVMGVLLPVAFLGALMSQFSTTVGYWFLWGDGYAIEGLLWFLHHLSGLQYTTRPIDIPSALLLGLGAVWLLTPKGFFGKKWALLCFLPLIAPIQLPLQNTAKVTMLDVGQGLSVVVQTRHHALVYDTGPKYHRFDAGKQIVGPFLRRSGIKNIDRLVLSHLDNDHIGGAKSVLNRFKVQNIDSSEAYPSSDFCAAGINWDWDGVHFEYLYPSVDDWDLKKNNRSCVLKISAKHQQLLLTGDIEKEAEQRLVQRQGDSLYATYLSSPHHGSKTSSSASFVEAVHPSAVLISAGFMSQYNHPHSSVIAHYDANHIRWQNTASEGGIQVVLH